LWYKSPTIGLSGVPTVDGERMILDLVLKLIDRVIDLTKEVEEVNRKTFVDFVQPAFQTFEIVHADYIDSMTRYGARLADTTLSMDQNHPVFRDIELDSLKSEHLRTKLKDFRPANSPPKLRPFLTAIDFYLRGLSASGARAEFFDNLALNRPEDLNMSDIEEALGGKHGIGDQPPEETFLEIGSPQMPYRFIHSDPMRTALREKLLGFDPPSDADAQWNMMRRTLRDEHGWYGTSDQRRKLCSAAVSSAMWHFQNSYSFVSSAYSALRSELISAT
jgi:hypothetical protein